MQNKNKSIRQSLLNATDVSDAKSIDDPLPSTIKEAKR